MIKFIFYLLGFISGQVLASDEENNLYNHLLQNYNKNIRPVKSYNKPVTTQLGLGVQTLESFDQMEETISLNIWMRMKWTDEYLSWNSSLSNLTFLSINPENIWTPNLNLINGAKKPEVYTLKGGLYLYNSGLVIWSMPSILTFSCALNLHLFPFDKQNCTMKISSWNYNKKNLELIPNLDKNSQVDILSTFSHSEWDLDHTELYQLEEERECCPDEIFDTLAYSFILKRYPHYYKISMGMTITLVLVSFIIMLMEPDNISRTGTAVFIPLTILALQLTIADKIAVVGYYTLMDYFFLLCFVTSMLCSIESGLIYSLITVKSTRLYNLIDKYFKIKIPEDIDLENNNNNNDNNDNNDNIDLENNNNDFNDIIQELDNHANNNIIIEESTIDDIPNDNLRRSSSYITSLRNRKTNIYSNNVYKVINFDDKRLYFTEKHTYINNLIVKYVCIIDNLFRILLPIIYFSSLIVIYNYE